MFSKITKPYFNLKNIRLATLVILIFFFSYAFFGETVFAQFKTGVKGKIVDGDNYPDVSIVPLASNEFTDTSKNCRGATYMNQYWSSASGGMTAFNKHLNDFATCESGKMLATFYKTQMEEDGESSIKADARIKGSQNLLNKVNLLLQDIKNVLKSSGTKTQDKLDITAYIIPRGNDTSKNYPFLKNVSTQCVKDNSAQTSIPEIAVGITDVKSGSILEATNGSLEKGLQDIKDKSEAIYSEIKTAGGDFAPGAKKFIEINAKILDEVSDISKKVSSQYFAVLPEDFQNDYPNFEKNAVAFSLTLDKNSSGNLIDCNKSVKLNFIEKGVAGNFYLAKVKVGDYSYQACLPAEYMATSLLEAFQGAIGQFNKLKSIYTKRIAQNTKLLADLTAKNYNCSSSVAPAVAKSGASDDAITLRSRVRTESSYAEPSVKTAVPTTPSEYQGIVPCGHTKTDANGVSTYTDHPCGFNDIITLVKNIINFLIYAGLILSGLTFIYVGWLYLSAGGNSGKITQAKDILWKVIWGFIIMCSAWLIVQTIEKTFVAPESGIKSFLN
jgi:hypothetical protein